jgi:hypothetical protein
MGKIVFIVLVVFQTQIKTAPELFLVRIDIGQNRIRIYSTAMNLLFPSERFVQILQEHCCGFEPADCFFLTTELPQPIELPHPLQIVYVFIKRILNVSK